MSHGRVAERTEEELAASEKGSLTRILAKENHLLQRD